MDVMEAEASLRIGLSLRGFCHVGIGWRTEHVPKDRPDELILDSRLKAK